MCKEFDKYLDRFYSKDKDNKKRELIQRYFKFYEDKIKENLILDNLKANENIILYYLNNENILDDNSSFQSNFMISKILFRDFLDWNISTIFIELYTLFRMFKTISNGNYSSLSFLYMGDDHINNRVIRNGSFVY